ncbi:MAG: hypothetical protein KF785_03455 [Gemmatimonadales bacterium]|nr:hypothetical protein [Gemmatimonadales bacterium]
MRPVLILGLIGLATGCGGAGQIRLPKPSGFVPGEAGAAAEWARSTLPDGARDIRFRWQFRDDKGAAGGRGRIRLAVPDSARLDVQGPLGTGRAAALVAGDTAVWAQPEDDVKRLVPNYPLFWALLGVVRAPANGAAVLRSADPELIAWRYHRGPDTLDYVWMAGTPDRLIAQVREGGRQVGTVETVFGPDGQPVSARLIVPDAPARLDITFSSIQKATSFDPDTWTPPQP